MKNVIFDIGNVLVKWSPKDIVRATFGDNLLVDSRVQNIFQHELWYLLNRGEINESQAKQQYQTVLGLTPMLVSRLFEEVKYSQVPVEGTTELVRKLKLAGYSLYALTDNVKEIVAHLRSQYEFWKDFCGVVVSAEVKCMKPAPEIYHHLINTYNIVPNETVFIDDHFPNVQGARDVGLKAIQFQSSVQCERDLRSMGLSF